MESHADKSRARGWEGEERQPRADERGIDQVKDKRYEIDVAEGARQEKRIVTEQ